MGQLKGTDAGEFEVAAKLLMANHQGKVEDRYIDLTFLRFENRVAVLSGVK